MGGIMREVEARKVRSACCQGAKGLELDLSSSGKWASSCLGNIPMEGVDENPCTERQVAFTGSICEIPMPADLPLGAMTLGNPFTERLDTKDKSFKVFEIKAASLVSCCIPRSVGGPQSGEK
jgi:hypothetical protein